METLKLTKEQLKEFIGFPEQIWEITSELNENKEKK